MSGIESTAGEIMLTGRQVQLLARRALKFTLLLMSRDTWWVHATRTSYAAAPHPPSPSRRQMRLARSTRRPHRRRAAARCGWPGNSSSRHHASSHRAAAGCGWPGQRAFAVSSRGGRRLGAAAATRRPAAWPGRLPPGREWGVGTAAASASLPGRGARPAQ